MTNEKLNSIQPQCKRETIIEVNLVIPYRYFILRLFIKYTYFQDIRIIYSIRLIITIIITTQCWVPGGKVNIIFAIYKRNYFHKGFNCLKTMKHNDCENKFQHVLHSCQHSTLLILSILYCTQYTVYRLPIKPPIDQNAQRENFPNAF